MAVTGWSGANTILQYAGDPVASALRVVFGEGGTAGLPVSAPAGGLPVINPYTSTFLVSARITTGTGAILTALPNGGGYGAGYYQINCTGNSASGAFNVSLDGVGWVQLTATAMASGVNTAIGQWSGYYPYITFVTTWISAGSNLTGTVWVALALK